ncbi:hypothetical protein ABBQ38_005343 [Trebouxia sp. C0009 RCD-2024]
MIDVHLRHGAFLTSLAHCQAVPEVCHPGPPCHSETEMPADATLDATTIYLATPTTPATGLAKAGPRRSQTGIVNAAPILARA